MSKRESLEKLLLACDAFKSAYNGKILHTREAKALIAALEEFQHAEATEPPPETKPRPRPEKSLTPKVEKPPPKEPAPPAPREPDASPDAAPKEPESDEKEGSQ